MIHRLLFSALVTLILALLTACGGGGCDERCEAEQPVVKLNPPNCNVSGVCS